MSSHEREHALKMLEQIAANFAWDEDTERAAAAVASHMQRFWAPEMRRLVIEAQKGGEPPLSPLAARAVGKL